MAVLALAGCDLALGLDDLDPGRSDEDDGSGASTPGGGEGGMGGEAAGGAGGLGGSGGQPSGYRGPAPGNYLLSGDLAGFPSPRFYITVIESGPEQVSLMVQALDAQSDTLVGNPSDHVDVPEVLPDSTHVTLGTIIAPGEANPLSGLPIVVEDVVLQFQQSRPPCGALDGQISTPIMQPLAGSTFFMTAVPNATELPSAPPVSCP